MIRFRGIKIWSILALLLGPAFSSKESLHTNNNSFNSESSIGNGKGSSYNSINDKQSTIWSLPYNNSSINARFYPTHQSQQQGLQSLQNPYQNYVQNLQNYNHLNPYLMYQLGLYNHLNPQLHTPTSFPTEKGLLFPLPISHYGDFKPTPSLLPNIYGGFFPSPSPNFVKPPSHLPGPPFGGHYQPPFDIGSLPNQVRVPGFPVVHVDPSKNILEIICEFPRYLILLQEIFWHFRHHDPYGTYFDNQNGFSPHVKVIAVDKWKSILTISPYTDDDVGIYRCLSTAILPSTPGTSSPLDLLHLGTRTTTDSIQPSSASSTSTQDLNLNEATLYEYDGMKEFPNLISSSSSGNLIKKQRASRIMKFPSTKEKSNIRFVRQLSLNSIEKDMTNDSTDKDDMMTSATANNNQLPTSRSAKLNELIYDLFGQTSKNGRDTLGGNTQQTENTILHNFRDPSINGINAHFQQLHLGRHIYPNGIFGNLHQHNHGFIHNPYPHFHQHPPTHPPIGLNAPYYKPSYGIVTVYQEAIFKGSPGIFRHKQFLHKFGPSNVVHRTSLPKPTIFNSNSY